MHEVTKGMSKRSELIPYSVLSMAMSRTLIQDSVYVYDGRYLAIFFVLSYPLLCDCKVERRSICIYTSVWEGFLFPPGS